MKYEELKSFAEKLAQMLAEILGGEYGYREIRCQACRGDGTERLIDDRSGTTGSVFPLCPACQGSRRMWCKKIGGIVSFKTDKQLVEAFG